MIINENSFIHKFMEKHSNYIDESYDRYLKKCEYYENLPEDDSDENENCEKTVETPTKNTVGNTQSNDKNETTDSGKTDTNDNKSVFNKLTEEKPETNKTKAFKLFAGLMKDAESGNEDDQHKEESSPEATITYQQAVANNLYGNTGVTNQISFSPASDFRTVEERISELFTRLMMETDRDKILYIVNQIINLVPDKEAFKKTLFSKLKGRM